MTTFRVKGSIVGYIVNAALGPAQRSSVGVGCETVAEAVAKACEFLDDGNSEVSIRDAKGHVIEGPELVACVRGEMRLTDDLQAVPV